MVRDKVHAFTIPVAFFELILKPVRRQWWFFIIWLQHMFCIRSHQAHIFVAIPSCVDDVVLVQNRALPR